MKENERALFKFCYENEIHFDQYNMYHYRLFYKGNILDVWPVSRKYWNNKMSCSRVYKKVSDIKPYILID